MYPFTAASYIYLRKRLDSFFTLSDLYLKQEKNYEGGFCWSFVKGGHASNFSLQICFCVVHVLGQQKFEFKH